MHVHTCMYTYTHTYIYIYLYMCMGCFRSHFGSSFLPSFLSARSTTQTAMAASSAMVSAHPLGPVHCYEWLHEGRASAMLFLEESYPWRIFFRTFFDDQFTNVRSESGWHGRWFQDVCRSSTTSRNRLGVVHTTTAGDMHLSLDGFRYLGMDAEWAHDEMTFEKKVGDDQWLLTRCGCGTKHRIVFKDWPFAVTPDVDPDVAPGPSVVDGMSTR